MRIWSLHPQYLDPQGLVAVWREALLARAVLRGETVGYRNHPQLNRFRAGAAPLSAINGYLKGIYAEARVRGYAFDPRKIGPVRSKEVLFVTSGQMAHEWKHLLKKLSVRSPVLYRRWRGVARYKPHPLFRVRPGKAEPWERGPRA